MLDSFATPWITTSQAPLSMGFPRQEYWSGLPFLSPGDLPNPEIEPRSPGLQADSFPAEPQGKPKNTGVGSLSLLQWILPTQDSNRGILHCRKILCQLSYQGSPDSMNSTIASCLGSPPNSTISIHLDCLVRCQTFSSDCLPD